MGDRLAGEKREAVVSTRATLCGVLTAAMTLKPGVVIFPVPGRGHLASTLEFAKRLNQQNRFSVTILNMEAPIPNLPTLSGSYYESIAASGLDIHFLDLPPVDRPPFSTPEDFISIYIQRHIPHVKNSILRLQSSVRVVALVVDLFATTMAEVGDELGIPVYLFFTSGAALLALMLHLPALDLMFESDYEALEEDIEVPGLGPVPPLVFPTPLMQKKTQRYWWFVEHGRRYRYLQGFIVNTFRELEQPPLQALEAGSCLPDHPTPSVFTVGPILLLEEEDPTHPCIRWLDAQPARSVVFLCFGSLGALPAPQVKEIALGLESSGHRFLWSVRSRRSEGFGPLEDADLAELMPEGFLDRTAGVGLVWPRWTPQTAILAHEAVGGFVSHCGWNSCLESLWFGLPLLAWPLSAEQRLNTFLMARQIGVAVEVEMDYKGGGTVPAAAVEKGVRCLMGESEEGERARRKVMEAKVASRAATAEGGSSVEALRRLTEKLLSPGGAESA